MFSDNNRIKLEVNTKRQLENSQVLGNSHIIHLGDPQVTVKVKWKLENILNWKNENTKCN